MNYLVSLQILTVNKVRNIKKARPRRGCPRGRALILNYLTLLRSEFEEKTLRFYNVHFKFTTHLFQAVEMMKRPAETVMKPPLKYMAHILFKQIKTKG